MARNLIHYPHDEKRKKIDSWFYRLIPLTHPRMRLICFPYAGGSANIFQEWHKSLPAGVEICAVELPGHQRRFGEPFIEDLSILLNELEREIRRIRHIPYAFFGHSLGALIAFELARRLCRINLSIPSWLFVSGTGPPSRDKDDDPMHTLPDDEFIDRLIKLGGIPESVLQKKDLLDLMLPILRSDVTMSELWKSPDIGPLRIGITALGGLKDPEVTLEDLEAWKAETEVEFRMHIFPGDHFFIQNHQNLVLKNLHAELDFLLRH